MTIYIYIYIYLSLKLQETSGGVNLKPLCPIYQLNAKTVAIEAILKDSTRLLEALEEIHSTTRDEYGLKADGLMQSFTLYLVSRSVIFLQQKVSFIL